MGFLVFLFVSLFCFLLPGFFPSYKNLTAFKAEILVICVFSFYNGLYWSMFKWQPDSFFPPFENDMEKAEEKSAERIV